MASSIEKATVEGAAHPSAMSLPTLLPYVYGAKKPGSTKTVEGDRKWLADCMRHDPVADDLLATCMLNAFSQACE